MQNSSEMTRRRLVVRQLAHSYGIAILRITYAGVMSQISIFFANGTSGSDLRCALNSQNSPTLGIFSSPRNLAKQLQAGSGLFRGFIIYTLHAPCTWPRALRVAAGAGAFCSQQQVGAVYTRRALDMAPFAVGFGGRTQFNRIRELHTRDVHKQAKCLFPWNLFLA